MSEVQQIFSLCLLKELDIAMFVLTQDANVWFVGNMGGTTYKFNVSAALKTLLNQTQNDRTKLTVLSETISNLETLSARVHPHQHLINSLDLNQVRFIGGDCGTRTKANVEGPIDPSLHIILE